MNKPSEFLYIKPSLQEWRGNPAASWGVGVVKVDLV